MDACRRRLQNLDHGQISLPFNQRLCNHGLGGDIGDSTACTRVAGTGHDVAGRWRRTLYLWLRFLSLEVDALFPYDLAFVRTCRDDLPFLLLLVACNVGSRPTRCTITSPKCQASISTGQAGRRMSRSTRA